MTKCVVEHKWEGCNVNGGHTMADSFQSKSLKRLKEYVNLGVECGAIKLPSSPSIQNLFSSILCIVYLWLEDVPTMHLSYVLYSKSFLISRHNLPMCNPRCTFPTWFLLSFAFMIGYGNSNMGIQLGIPFLQARHSILELRLH